MSDRTEDEGLDPALAAIWKQNLPTTRARLGTLERSAEAHAHGSDPGREEAARAAHQLAGSLGSFGLPRGSELARRLERRFEEAGTLGDPAELQRAVGELRALVERWG